MLIAVFVVDPSVVRRRLGDECQRNKRMNRARYATFCSMPQGDGNVFAWSLVAGKNAPWLEVGSGGAPTVFDGQGLVNAADPAERAGFVGRVPRYGLP